MKKELLFIMNNLNCGGAEKALVSLLQTIDYTKYTVDLYLFKKEGVFLKQVPKQVTILPEPEFYPYFDMSIKKAIVENLKKGRLKVIFYRILAGFVYKTEKIPAVKEQKVWKYLKKNIQPLDKYYDVAIGYLEKTPNYFCVDKVDAKHKVGFIHTDYINYKMDSKIDFSYFKKLTSLITVSDSCKMVLENIFPLLKHKFHVLNNIVSSKAITLMSKEPIVYENKGFSLFSVGRLSTEKGFDLAIEACNILIKKGIDVYWYVIGEGMERKNLELLIKKNKLEDRFLLLGLKENPYPYIKAANVYVQPSKFEGKSIAIDEAKILQKPMVVTNFTTVRDQINHEYNGLIAEMNPESIAENIERLILDKNLRNQFTENLAKENFGTEQEIEKFYKLIEN